MSGRSPKHRQSRVTTFRASRSAIAEAAELSDDDERSSRRSPTASALRRVPERSPEEFRRRVEQDLAEQRERVQLRRKEQESLVQHVTAIDGLVDGLVELSRYDVADESARRLVAQSIQRASENELLRSSAPPPRRVGFGAAAVVDVAAQSKIDQLHKLVNALLSENQQLRTRLAASEFESSERAERIAELETMLISLQGPE